MKESIATAVCACLITASIAAQTPAAQPGQKPAPPATAGQKPVPTAGDKPVAQDAAGDTAFMRQAAMAGMAEVAHGQLAAQNATSAEVKQFAQRMVDDHGKANDELKALASKKNVTLPTTLDAKHQAMQDKLAALKGEAFDRAYMSHMVAAHGQAFSLFTREAKGGSDADVKAFAQSKVPTIQEHRKMAQSINSKVGGAAKGQADPAKKEPPK